MSRRFAAVVTCAFLVGAAGSMLWSQTTSSPIRACVGRDGTTRILLTGTVCKNQETRIEWYSAGPAALSGYEILEGAVLLNETGGGIDRMGGSQKWNTGRAHCSDGKRILGGAHHLEFQDGNRLTDEDWATLVQWSTQLTTTINGTGEYQVTVLNPQEIALRAFVTIVCANVAS